MSKAFTKEDGEGAALEGVVPLLPRTAPGQTRYLTREGAEALRAELERLSAERSSLRTARPDAPRAQEVERRLQRVAEVLASAAVAPAVRGEGEDGRALFGAWVEIEDDDGARRTFRLVGPDEADARAGRISVSSPFGRALLGKRAGDEATVELPRGASTITLISVSSEAPGAA